MKQEPRMTDEENFQWHRKRIEEATNRFELNLAADDVGCDVFENEGWTHVKARVDELRELFRKRTEEIDAKLRMERGAVEPTS